MSDSPTDADLAMIRLAAAFYRFEGARHTEIRERFGLSATRFWQRVNVLLDDPAVAVAEPVLVGRLRRQRDARLQQKRAS